MLLTGMFSGLMDTVFGGVRPIYDDSVTSMYTATNASSKEEALLNAQNFNIQLAEEGFVLLKNENSALPLSAAHASASSARTASTSLRRQRLRRL